MMGPIEPRLREALTQRFPEVFPAEGELDQNGVLVPAHHHVALARLLKEEFGFTLYVSVIATHFPLPEGDTFEVATVLRHPRGAALFWWRVPLGADPEIPTLYELFVGADWQEREQFDLVGVKFVGHPDPRRLMLPEDWEGYPLRKNYAINTPHAPWR
jgi:NADH:ubiquinone oxidoreductase subunit C